MSTLQVMADLLDEAFQVVSTIEPESDAEGQRLALLLIVFTYCLASVQLLATQSRVFLAFISLVLTPTIVRVASDTPRVTVEIIINAA